MIATEILATPADVAAEGAATFARLLERADGPFRVGFAGGSTPRAMHRLLAEMSLDWSRLHAYLGDDRHVPEGHEQSNAGTLRTDLLSKVPVAAFHPMVRGGSPSEDAAAYAALLEGMTLDLLFVGLGDDGHTLSLFPDDPTWHDAVARAIAARAPANWPDRVTLSAAYAATARQVVLLATGAAKREALARALDGPEDWLRTPVQSILRHAPEVLVLCDREAAPDRAALD